MSLSCILRSMLPVLICTCVLTLVGQAAPADPAAEARRLIEQAGIQGGLVVHVGCGNGRLTAALRLDDRFTVHGLAADEKDLAAARRTIEQAGLYGPVSIDRLAGDRLPYIDNLVNLVVVQPGMSVSMDEVLRVLRPGGVVLLGQGDRWQRRVKPYPVDIDQWTHYMHDATGNAVSNDTRVGPPRRLQWVGAPKWSRHHEHMSSFSAMVTAAGRLFYIVDEGSRLSIQLPAHWKLVARDAFNGLLLWKRDIPLWYTHIYPLKSGPAFLPRRLVAHDNRVYVTLGLGRPVEALDATTGRTVLTYSQTEGAEEILYHDGMLLVVADPQPPQPDHYTWKNPVCWTEVRRVAKERPWDWHQRHIWALDARTGKTLWQHFTPIAPLTLAADDRHVVFHDGKKLVCLDRATGKVRWNSPPVKMRLPLPTSYAPTLVLYRDVVLFAGGDRKMSGFDAGTGRHLWTADHYRAGHHSPEDLLVIDGLAWTGMIAGGGDSGLWTGYDVQTGRPVRQFTPDVQTYWFHHRCYRSKATVRYLLSSRTGIEFIDWKKQHWIPHHWVRGACLYGIMPANGLIYAPPHPCACYIESKLTGLNALAPAADRPLPTVPESRRLLTGPAYRKAPAPTDPAGDWPTYRHDNARSGYNPIDLPPDLRPAWQTDLGGRLTSPVIAQGLCFLADPDRHRLYGLDARTGRPVWQFTAGGPIDSPPTIADGYAVFGCHDGYVYCLRASDGQLAWRYLVAPADRRTIAYDRLESLWPIPGNVLVQDGQVYCVAGRSMFLDGGLHLCRIDLTTGRLIRRTVLDDRVPGSQDNLQTTVRGLNMPPALPDILSSDGHFIYMRSQRFDLDGKRTELFAGNPSWDEKIAQQSAAEQIGPGVHLFCGTGFLDDSWFHRSYWLYGRMIHNGCNFWFRAARYAPSGRILAFNEQTVFGFGRKPQYVLWTPALQYRLFATPRQVKPQSIQRVLHTGQSMAGEKKGRWIFDRQYLASKSDAQLSAADVLWSQDQPPLLVRAMALTRRVLFIAGPVRLLDEEAAVARHYDNDVQKQILEQEAALAGRHPAHLWAVNTADGRRLAGLELQATPVWDGMAAAGDRLFLVTTDGKVTCFAGR